ncbi:MAG: hypothetical protein K0Q49_1044 [Haloplasmataceae bacterium]|jgi:hypothetical protein|nr:hypothetical protein [Haloplasmataceae bacterium]
MKLVLNFLCIIVSIVFMIIGLILSINDYGIDNPVTGPIMLFIGTLGLLLELYLYNVKK